MCCSILLYVLLLLIQVVHCNNAASGVRHICVDSAFGDVFHYLIEHYSGHLFS